MNWPTTLNYKENIISLYDFLRYHFIFLSMLEFMTLEDKTDKLKRLYIGKISFMIDGYIR